jgi:hypothetical protein
MPRQEWCRKRYDSPDMLGNTWLSQCIADYISAVAMSDDEVRARALANPIDVVGQRSGAAKARSVEIPTRPIADFYTRVWAEFVL